MQPEHTLQPDTTTPLSLALSYIEAGIPVFPCRSRESHDPDTGEVYGAKTPLTPNGLKGATTTERIIRVWWDRNPDAMIGLPTGAKAGFFVLDVDNKPGGANGFDWLDEMEALHGPLPTTARVRTPNSGVHILFNYVAGTRNRGALGDGVDIRSEGGYVVAAGSVMGDGRRYEWVDADGAVLPVSGGDDMPPIADAPQWLLDLVLKPAPEATHYAAPYQTGQNEPYVNAAVSRELDTLAASPQGSRNNDLNDAAFALGQFVGAGALSRSEAEAALFSVASAWPNHKLSLGTIKRGLDSGQQHPRAIPERQEQPVDNTTLRSIDNIIARAKGKVGHTQERISEEYTESRIEGAEGDGEPLSSNVDTKPDSVQDSAHAAPSAQPAPEPDEPFFATPFSWIDPAKLPRREFAFGTHYIRKYVSVTVSPGGLGKTSNSIAEGLAMVSGRALTGTKPPARLKTWIFNAEDPRDEMERRIMAAAIHYKLKPDDLSGLFLDSGREQELVVAREDRKTGVTINEPVVEAVVANILRHGIDVMIVDPFVSTHRVNENDNGAIDRVAKLWAQIADQTNCAIDVVHHLKKLSDREATVEDARGAVALIGAARSVRVLNRMTDDQAAKAGISEADRFSYFWIHHGKANLTRMDNAQHWRKLESVPLGNGRGLSKPQDHAGVVTEWKWPSNEDMAEAVPDDARAAVMVKLANQNYRESPQSDDWAGYVLADALGMDVAIDRKMTPEKKKAKAVLDHWLSSGLLTTFTDIDIKRGGRPIKYVRPAA